MSFQLQSRLSRYGTLLKGVLNPDEVILVDFDQAHYGFRMWDILYFLSNWDLPSDEEFEEIIQSKTYCEFKKD